MLSEICAQIVWTLSPLRRRSEIRVDGEPVDIEGVPRQQTVEDWAAYDPDAVPLDAVGHYVSCGALHTVTAGAPTPGPAGTGAYGSPAPRSRPIRAPGSCPSSWGSGPTRSAPPCSPALRRRARPVLTRRR